MLKSLYIKDYALIDSITVEFEKGLNIITGETGAGKSILIGAMGILLGERASTEVIRKDAAKAIIEGIFDITGNNKVIELLATNEIDYTNELIIRREISAKGSSRIFINDTPVNLNMLKEIGDLLVDLHGQHEHQSLLRSDKHIDFLDEYINVNSLKEEYKKILTEINNTKNELDLITAKEATAKEKFDLYSFQLKEIEEISPALGEEEELEKELNILENSEKLTSLNTLVFELLYDSENSVYDKISEVKSLLQDLSKIDEGYLEKINEIETVNALIQDIAEFSRSYLSKIDLDPAKLEEIRGRLISFNRLKKKYGGTIANVLEYKDKIKTEIELVTNFSEKITELNNTLNNLRLQAGGLAKKISDLRKEGSAKLKKEIEESLTYLGINNSCFEVWITQKLETENEKYIICDGNKYKYNVNGYDEVEFYISTNKGEDPKPLAKVASGGEISRIMLALKTSLAKNETLPLLIFDEIDTGVSGRIGQKVGIALKNLANYHQIIAITHLPQIAALADTHFAVEKGLVNDRVVSVVKKLTNEERLNEVAKLLSGEEITETGLKTAKELIEFKY